LVVVPDHGRVLLERALRRRDRLERLVVHFDELERVLRDVRALGDDSGHLLPLEADFVRGEDGLRVAREGRHPGQVVLRHELAGDDRDHAFERVCF